MVQSFESSLVPQGVLLGFVLGGRRSDCLCSLWEHSQLLKELLMVWEVVCDF